MAETAGDNTVVDRALETGKKAASAVGSGIKKATNLAADKISTAKGSTMITVMRWGNIILGVALILCYPIGLLTKKATLGFTSTFMMIYCICFSGLLVFFESGLGKFEDFIRKYFGFMYSYMGRTLFTLFTVAMVFGCADSEGKMFLMSIIVGTIGIFFCIFSCFVVCKHPAFQKGGEFYRDPNDVAAGVPAAPAKKSTPAAAPAKKAAAYEANPFESSSDDDIPSASVPGAKAKKETKPAKKAAKKPTPVDNPFEDDNPFDD
ncbi:transmembrane protein [Blastocystis sp. ATCC 50177/Nand II]|uniref:Transmembrane protein n=1 Tax=Blastocystis sp. subtype 1 (strain ATCC 50177 / NandII) TaxID=478820 RepID=A0A196SLU5_BLAHN|nr:transmembrane protein [Blastocystis sp. ATCC 50177/Nand II]